MKKLKLNKKTISVLDRVEMGKIDGGFTCLVSCDRGTHKGKTCCNSGGAGGTLNLVGYCKSVLAPEKPVDKEFIKDRLLFEGVEKF